MLYFLLFSLLLHCLYSFCSTKGYTFVEFFYVISVGSSFFFSFESCSVFRESSDCLYKKNKGQGIPFFSRDLVFFTLFFLFFSSLLLVFVSWDEGYNGRTTYYSHERGLFWGNDLFEDVHVKGQTRLGFFFSFLFFFSFFFFFLFSCSLYFLFFFLSFFLFFFSRVLYYTHSVRRGDLDEEDAALINLLTQEQCKNKQRRDG